MAVVWRVSGEAMASEKSVKERRFSLVVAHRSTYPGDGRFRSAFRLERVGGLLGGKPLGSALVRMKRMKVAYR